MANMKCKNCQAELVESSSYCHKCGAKVITKRVNTKSLLREFSVNFLGWDNSFLKTLKTMLIAPNEVISAYLDGVRKKYVSPFLFVAVGTAIAMLVFNSFSDEYFEFSNTIGQTQYEFIQDSYEDGSLSEEEYKKQTEVFFKCR